MLPNVSFHGLVQAKVLNPGDQLCTPAQSAKLAPRIDVGIDCASVIYFAVVDPRDDESVEIGHVLEVANVGFQDAECCEAVLAGVSPRFAGGLGFSQSNSVGSDGSRWWASTRSSSQRFTRPAESSGRSSMPNHPISRVSSLSGGCCAPVA